MGKGGLNEDDDYYDDDMGVSDCARSVSCLGCVWVSSMSVSALAPFFSWRGCLGEADGPFPFQLGFGWNCSGAPPLMGRSRGWRRCPLVGGCRLLQEQVPCAASWFGGEKGRPVVADVGDSPAAERLSSCHPRGLAAGRLLSGAVSVEIPLPWFCGSCTGCQFVSGLE